MGSSIVRINETGVDALFEIWVDDSDEYLFSSTTDSNQKFVKFVDFQQKFRKNSNKNHRKSLCSAEKS